MDSQPKSNTNIALYATPIIMGPNARITVGPGMIATVIILVIVLVNVCAYLAGLERNVMMVGTCCINSFYWTTYGTGFYISKKQ